MKKLYLLLLAMLLSGCSLLDVLNEPAVDLNDDSVTAEFTPSAETMNYHYHQLDEEGQRAYGLLLSGLEEMNSEIELGKIDGQTLETAFVAVMKDNPALFHVQNDYTYEEYSDGSITMKPQYYLMRRKKQTSSGRSMSGRRRSSTICHPAQKRRHGICMHMWQSMRNMKADRRIRAWSAFSWMGGRSARGIPKLISI